PAPEAPVPASQQPAEVSEAQPEPAVPPPDTAVSVIEQKAETPAMEQKPETLLQEALLSVESSGSLTEKPPERRRSLWVFIAGIGSVCAAVLLAIAGLKRWKK
ncbi:MAG: hypothetical protein LBE10_03265, partial [Treponema sp.]|nr:hypothetical protein [Treponema sp.]